MASIDSRLNLEEDVFWYSKRIYYHQSIMPKFILMMHTSYRRDRAGGQGRVTIIIKKNFIDKETKRVRNAKESAKWQQSRQRPIRCLSFLHCVKPPKNNKNEPFIVETHYLSNTQENNPIWIGGEFNLPDIDWEKKSINNYKFPKQLNERFIDLIDGQCMNKQQISQQERRIHLN